jgi:hypothetical protein
MNACTHACFYRYLCTHICMYACKHVYASMCVHLLSNECVHARTHPAMFSCMFTCMYAQTFTCHVYTCLVEMGLISSAIRSRSRSRSRSQTEPYVLPWGGFALSHAAPGGDPRVSCLVTLARCWPGCTFSEGPRLRKTNPPHIERIERIEHVCYVYLCQDATGYVWVVMSILFKSKGNDQ